MLPRRTALHCIIEHRALARRPSIQPNILTLCLARSVRQLLSARCPQCRNLINTNRNNERANTQIKLKHDKYLVRHCVSREYVNKFRLQSCFSERSITLALLDYFLRGEGVGRGSHLLYLSV